MSWRSLVRKSEFQEVYARGAKRIGRLLVVYLLPAGDLAWAVVASRKVGGAVQRNRAKRLLREARRTGLLGQPGSHGDIRARFFCGSGGSPVEQDGNEGMWVVMVARRAILDADSREVREELDDLLHRH